MTAAQGGGLVSGYSYTNTEASDFVARAVTAGGTTPSDPQKGDIDALFTVIKSVGIAKFDLFQLLVAHEAVFSRQNLISSSFASTVVGTPTFTADRGWNGWSTSNYLDTGYQPSSAGTLIDQNDNHMGVWVQDNILDIGNDCGLSSYRITARNTGDLINSRNSAGTSDNAMSGITDSTGFSMIRRNSSTIYKADKNGAGDTTVTRTTASQGAGNIFIGCRSESGTPTNATARRIAAICAGSWLTAGESAALYTGLAAYMTARGA